MGLTTGVSKHSNDSEAVEEMKVPPPGTSAEWQPRLSHVPLAAVVVFVVLLYVLFATGGMMTTLPPTSDVYGLLAESFTHGRIDLLLDPPPQLATVENPYDPTERVGIDVSTDASYYRGRYFVYWGPAPAALAIFWKAVFQRPLGDAGIAFLAAVVTFLFALLLLLRLRRLYFPSLPAWLIAASTAVAGLAHPILWNLNFPAIYEAAIGAGQAFLLAGLYFAVSSIGGSAASRRNMALAGALWGLAVASRLTLVPAVGALLLGTLSGMAVSKRRQISAPSLLPAMGSLILPLALIVGLLGSYNYLRFGEATETGFRFQLVPDLDYTRLMAAGEVFNPKYLAPNILYYSVAPATLSEGFPFLVPVRGGLPWDKFFITRLGAPSAYSVEDVTGVLLAVPFILFSGLLVGPRTLRSRFETSSRIPSPNMFAEKPNIGATRVGLTVVAAAVLTALSTLAYRHVANRFELDYVPLLIIASSIGAWQLHHSDRGRRIRRTLINVLIALAVLSTLLAGILLGASRP